MSRVSSRSSPSGTSGGINLRKDEDIDLGKKTQPSASSGGIGLTQEVGNIGGMSVTGGIAVDVSPIELDISANIDPSDPNKNSISIAGSAELPGGLIGLGGGVKINTNTGAIQGGSITGEIGGFGVEVSADSEEGLGVTLSYQIPFTPVVISLGFGEGKKDPDLIPILGPDLTPPQPRSDWTRPVLPVGDNNKSCWVCCLWDVEIKIDGRMESSLTNKGSFTPFFDSNNSINRFEFTITQTNFPSNRSVSVRNNPGTITHLNYSGRDASTNNIRIVAIERSDESEWVSYTTVGYMAFGRESDLYRLVESGYRNTTDSTGRMTQKYYPTIVYSSCSYPPTPTPTPYFPPSPTSLPPNPPPRKEMDECCRLSIRLQRLTVRHLGAVKPPNQEALPEGINPIGSNQEGFNQAFPFEVRKKWIDPVAKEGEKIQITNARQLSLILGGMMERLERVLGTAEFYKDSDKKLRQSEGNLLSWLNGKNDDFKYPDPNDFWLNTDDGIINEKKLEIRSIADGLRYQVEALNRLERILPIAELKDSSIPARWIYPNGKGQLRVGNLIHLCEYMIRKSDKDMGYWPQKITIKAGNPAIKDDEPITADVHSQADMLKVILQQILDIEGDGDMGSNYDLRRTYLDVMAFQMVAKNNKYLQAITEYLSFEMTEEVSKIPIPFDPFAGQDRSIIESWWNKLGFGEEKLSLPEKNTESEIEELSEKLLQNSELEINTVKFGSPDEKKDPKTLKEALIEILKHSSASSAAVTEVATEGALERIVSAAGLAQKLTSFLMRRDIRESLGIGDLDNWIASAEKGYADNLESESLRFPESNSLEPYGRPAAQNPVIREIDTKDSKAD